MFDIIMKSGKGQISKINLIEIKLPEGPMGVKTPPAGTSPVREEARNSDFRWQKHSVIPVAEKNLWREGEAGVRTMALSPRSMRNSS